MKRSDSPATSGDGDVEDGAQQLPSGEDTDAVANEAEDDPTGRYLLLLLLLCASLVLFHVSMALWLECNSYI